MTANLPFPLTEKFKINKKSNRKPVLKKTLQSKTLRLFKVNRMKMNIKYRECRKIKKPPSRRRLLKGKDGGAS